ncbi:MAG: 4Fe-4S dicluster domain-containing protein [bacterium]
MFERPFRQVTKRLTGHAVWRGAVCLSAAGCAVQLAGPAWLAGRVPSLSPFTALLAVAAGAGGFFLLGAAAIAAACVFSPRVFCRWLCPVGTCHDAITCRMPKQAWLGRLPQIGLGVLFVGLGAALAGYPLFGWLDPLALFNAAFGVARTPLGLWDWIAAAGLPLLLVLSLLAPGLWCGKLCPLGALQDLARFPLRQTAAGAVREKEVAALSRRTFLGLGVGAGYRLVLPPGRETCVKVIRPPASGRAARFTRLCVRCGTCVRTCPGGILRFGGVGAGLAGVLAPEVFFENDYCHPDCTACGQACPSGAIQKFSAEHKFAQPLGVAKLNEADCLLGQNRECGACVGVCSQEALILTWDPVEMISRVVVNEKTCTGCGYCEYVCVSTPKAIIVKALSR